MFRRAPIILAASYAIVVLLLCQPKPLTVVRLATEYAAAIGAVTIFLGSVFWLRALQEQPGRSEGVSAVAILRCALESRWQADRWLSVWQPLAIFVTVMTTFSLFKQTALPSAGFGMGPAIADADRALLGQDAWRVTHGLLSSPWATQAIDLAYHAWFLPMTLGVALCVYATPGARLAQRYLLGFALLWVVQGSMLAYFLPAAGPVYFSHFQLETGRFVDLAARLAEQDAWLRAAGAPGLSALTFQGYLLELFGTRQIALGGGISAMPSLHNAMAILFACAARHLSPRLGLLFAGYAAVIWIGSVQLGWHYALDGLVALAATMATWRATGWFHEMLARRPSGQMVQALPASIS